MNMESHKLKPSIGFIGMGHMGSHMAQRLLDAGYQVTVYDRTEENAKALGQRGALMARTPKELAMIQFMEELAGLSTNSEEPGGN